MNDIQEKVRKLFGRIPEKKRPLILLIAGIVIMLILVLPEYSKKSDTAVKNSETADMSENEYISETEKKLTELISSIEGAGRTKVMLTVASSQENVYAYDINGDKSEYVILKSNSNEGGMLLKVRRPEIKGVAVVCEGGDSSKVKVDIVNAVSSSLGVSSTRISIAKMKSGAIK